MRTIREEHADAFYRRFAVHTWGLDAREIEVILGEAARGRPPRLYASRGEAGRSVIEVPLIRIKDPPPVSVGARHG
jgi:hypothetical protein